MMSQIKFSTTDIVLAAYLRTKGYALAHIRKDEHRGTFIFETVSQQDIEEYKLGSARVEPVSFKHMISQLTTSVRRIGT